MKDDLFFPSLESVLAHYGVDLPFSYSGVGWVPIRCPVHDERNPSCTINLELGKIHCHACGFAGDALDLIKELESLGTVEASDYARESFPEAAAPVGRRGGGAPRDRLRRPRGGRGRPSRLSRTRWD